MRSKRAILHNIAGFGDGSREKSERRCCAKWLPHRGNAQLFIMRSHWGGRTCGPGRTYFYRELNSGGAVVAIWRKGPEMHNVSSQLHINGVAKVLIGKESSRCGRETEDVLPSGGERG